MYGWDSYFIIRGLIEDGRIDLARGMVDNFLFEIKSLRKHSECKSNLLSHAFATAISYFNDPGRL